MKSYASDASPCTHIRWLIVAMLMGLAVLGHFNRISISVAGSERFIAEQLIDATRMGQVYTIFLLVYTAFMMPAGWLIDRYGPTNSLAAMGLGMGLCVVLTGVVGWLGLPGAGLWAALMLVRGVAGATSAPLHPAAARCIGLWIPLRARIWANGLVTAGALVGIAATYPLFGWLMDHVGWQWAFVACGVTMVAFAIVWKIIAADHASQHAWSNAAEAKLVARHHLPGVSSTKRSLGDFLRLFRRRDLMVLSVSYAAVGYFQYVFFYWIEHYFTHTFRLTNPESRRMSSVVMISMAVGMALGGWCADWFCHRYGLRWGRRIMAVGGMLLCAWLAGLGQAALEPDRAMIWFSLAFAALGLCEGVFWTTVTDIGGRTAGLAAAFMNTLGNGIGALAPWLTPLLMQRYGWQSAILFACWICGIGGLLWLALDPGRRADAKG